jgi:hypothetical protein
VITLAFTDVRDRTIFFILLQEQKAACRFDDIASELEVAVEDVRDICRTISELGMVYILNEDGSVRQSEIETASKAIWWEFTGPYLKDKSWSIMPVSEKAPHKLRIEMSKIVREEAKLDVWISRLRRLKSVCTDKDHLYVTPSDILDVSYPDQTMDTSRSKKKKAKTKRVPVAAVHAPFGSRIQTSTPIRHRHASSRATNRKYQLLVSCQEHQSDPFMPGEFGTDTTETIGKSSEHLQIHLFPENGRGKTNVLEEHPMLKWIEDPAFVTSVGGAGDNYHVSCLREEEGVSSFF